MRGAAAGPIGHADIGAALEAKRQVVAAAVARHGTMAADPFELLRRLGGLEFAAMSGAILAESVFNWPGLSTPLLRAVEARDYPMVVGIVLTLAYLFKMMRGLFYGPMDQKYSHAHDAVAVVDRLPLLIMITVSIGFFFFPMHLYHVVRSGVDPLIAKITRVVPVAALDRKSLHVKRETTSPPRSSDAPVLAINPLPLTPYPSRRSD